MTLLRAMICFRHKAKYSVHIGKWEKMALLRAIVDGKTYSLSAALKTGEVCTHLGIRLKIL
jgi:hypothetical protein